jgi:1,4-dihydroxy-2-naphthoate octaprenyltransferase
MFCAYFYQAPPFKLSYRGFGELAVALCYGPLICVGTYLVLRGKIDIVPLLVSIPLGLLIAAFLWVDEFPDFASDEKANKRTLVVRLGRRAASRLFPLIFGAAFGILFLLPGFGLPKQVVLGGIALVPAVPAAIRVWNVPEHTAKLIPAQRNTLLAFVLYAALAGLGLLIA